MKIVTGTAALLMLGFTGAASAQAYPTKPVRLVVAGTPTGASGTAAAVVAPILSETWKQEVVVENRSSAGGIVGADIVAKATPDGYTLLACSIASHGIGPAVNKKLPYDHIKDFAPISRIGTLPNVLIVHPSVPAKSVKEFLAHAKANPGKIQYASSGVGNSPHLAMELLRSMTGINVVHMQVGRDRETNAEVMSGRAMAAFSNVTAVLPHAKAGKLRALGVTSAKRSPQLPDVPTFIESGVAGFEVTVWSGLCAPAAVPKATITKINGDVVKVLKMAETQKRLAERGVDAAPSSPGEFAAFIKSETARWAKVVKSAGIEPK